MKKFELKTSIVYDCTLNELNHYCQGVVLVVCDPFFIENNIIEELKSSLTNAQMIEVYSDVKPDPTLESVVDGVYISKKVKPDVMIALGGGSAIDLAKAIMFFDKKSDSTLDYSLIAIPTTSGTGSEVTSFAVVTDTKNKKKIPLVSDELLPDIAFLESRLVEQLPKSIIAYTGMDAITHNIEAIVSLNASVYSDAFALKSLELLKNNLANSYHNRSKDSRINVHVGSTLAGVAFNEASLGLNHAIAHQLGAIFKIPHGQCNAILLPEVIKYNAKNETAKNLYNKLAYDLHLTNSLSSLGYLQLISWVNKLKSEFKIENRLSELGINKAEYYENLDLIATNALNDQCIKTNPISLTHEEMICFLRRLY